MTQSADETLVREQIDAAVTSRVDDLRSDLNEWLERMTDSHERVVVKKIDQSTTLLRNQILSLSNRFDQQVKEIRNHSDRLVEHLDEARKIQERMEILVARFERLGPDE